MKITIVGVGALGSHVVPLIRNLKAELVICDMDRIETKNTMSQFHGRPGQGKMKVEALKQAMSFMWGTKLTTVPHKLTSDNVEQVLSGAGLIVDCLDNGAARRLIQGYARKNQIPCLHGALAAEGAYGRVCWDESFVIDDEPGMGAPTCEDGAHLAFISIVSSYLASSIKDFLIGGLKVGYEISPRSVFST